MKLNLSTIKRIQKPVVDEFERDARRRQVWLDDSNVVDDSDDIIINQDPNLDDNDLLSLTNLEHTPDFTDTYVGEVGDGSHICQDPYMIRLGWKMGKKRVRA